MKWLDDLKRKGVLWVQDTETAWTLRREKEAAAKRRLEGEWKHLVAAQLENCRELDTRSLIALAVATAQEIQNGLILGNVVRSQHEKGHAGAHLNGFDDVLFYRDLPVDLEAPDSPTFYDLLKESRIEGAFRVPLTHHGVSVAPWNVKRLTGNLPYYGAERPWEEQSDHHFEVLWPIPVLWVFSGNHSFTAGILNKSGFVDIGTDKTAIQDISPFYEHVYCDGSGMRRRSDDTPLERLSRSPLPWDVRWGLLFELGRIIAARRGWVQGMGAWCQSGLPAAVSVAAP